MAMAGPDAGVVRMLIRKAIFGLPIAMVFFCAGAIEAAPLPAIDGGSGDASFEDRCPPGKYLVGLKIRSGAWIDQLTTVCAFVEANGYLSAAIDGPARGGNGGGPAGNSCSQGQVISRMWVSFTAGNRQVKNFRFACRSTTNSTPSAGFAIGNGDPGTAGAPSGEICRSDGGINQAAVGVYGRYGRHVSAAGLICGNLVLQPPRQFWPLPPSQAAQCPSGYVWIGVPPDPSKCVTPAERAAAATAAKSEAEAAREKLLGGVADFAGTWATTTGKGGVYELTLRVDGNTVTGEFINNVDAKYNGTLTGMWMGDSRLHYKWTQPATGDSGKGTFSVYTDDKLDGNIRYKVPGDVQEHLTWWRGTRTSTFSPFDGIWNTKTSGGGYFQLVLTSNGEAVRGSFREGGSSTSKYNGTLTGKIEGGQLLYTFTQPATGGTGSGRFSLKPGGAEIAGAFKMDNDPNTEFLWSGNKVVFPKFPPTNPF